MNRDALIDNIIDYVNEALTHNYSAFLIRFDLNRMLSAYENKIIEPYDEEIGELRDKIEELECELEVM